MAPPLVCDTSSLKSGLPEITKMFVKSITVCCFRCLNKNGLWVLLFLIWVLKLLNMVLEEAVDRVGRHPFDFKSMVLGYLFY